MGEITIRQPSGEESEVATCKGQISQQAVNASIRIYRQSRPLLSAGSFPFVGVTLIAGRGGRGISITTTFTPNCAASFGSHGA